MNLVALACSKVPGASSLPRRLWGVRTAGMQDPANDFRGISLLGTRVNKGKEKGRGYAEC